MKRYVISIFQPTILTLVKSLFTVNFCFEIRKNKVNL